MSDVKSPSFMQALVCFGGILAIIIVGAVAFQVSMHVLLMSSIMWTCSYSYFLGFRFSDLRNSMSGGISKGLSAIYIFVLIGVVIAAFMESGTIASLVYYSLDIIHPAVFLPAGFVLCSIMSVAVGTSFGTAGTAGVILIGVGATLGFPLPIVAGMVIAGATFGDKISPISDTTNLAAVAAGTDLYKHINSMMYTTVPTFIICLILFAFIGLEYATQAPDTAQIEAFRSAIDENFVVSAWTVLPILVMFGLSINKVPAEPAMLSSVIVAGVLAIVLQDRTLIDILGSLQDGFKTSTGHEGLDLLVNRGGIQSMMWTLSLALFALALGGILDVTGYLTVLLKKTLSNVKTVFSGMLTAMCTGLICCLSMGETYISIIVTSQLMKKKFEEMKFKPYLLSRSIEESTTLPSSLVPWSMPGAFYFGVLGVPVIEYAPWAILNYLNMFVSLGMAYFGYGIFKNRKD